ncbi:MAG: FhlB domain-containing protein [Candidatus Methylomirabilis oxygeniifera]|uniref:Cytoplasmic domain of flagellar protein FhlB-like protein protein n=1 Tax=Methylomirabilis oxygeniifera TaxID=671143 RepID=D5MG92_METO1|nr:MAG: FhlB domain-containing protein [Candidatus Methylomirabilis oxyfera]CBE68773.1 Cytoplasmic domain of flagellar protein FhlB-like protein protein [Candidatus Methylomirabilis oxyfera]
MATRRRSSPEIQQAVALKYEAGENGAPEVVASGRGRIAEQIIALAKAHGIYVKQDPELVEVLSRLDIGDAIPPELYAVVAEILAFVYRVNAKRDLHNSLPPSSR